jgi:hypothetical protein
MSSLVEVGRSSTRAASLNADVPNREAAVVTAMSYLLQQSELAKRRDEIGKIKDEEN